MRRQFHRIGTWRLGIAFLLLVSGHLRAEFSEVGLKMGREIAGYSLAVSSKTMVDPGSVGGIVPRLDRMPLASEAGRFQRNLWLFMVIPTVITIIILLGMLSQEEGRFQGRGPGPADGKSPPGQAPPDAQGPGGVTPRLAAPGPVNVRMILRGRDQKGNVFELPFGSNDFSREGGVLVVGRSRDRCHLVLSHDSVSRQHISLTLQGESLVVRDLNSANGSSLNGTRLANQPSGIPLRPGDRIRVGEIDCVYDRV